MLIKKHQVSMTRQNRYMSDRMIDETEENKIKISRTNHILWASRKTNFKK